MAEKPKSITKLRIRGTDYEIADEAARAKIPERTSQLVNDSDFTSLTAQEHAALCTLLDEVNTKIM